MTNDIAFKVIIKNDGISDIIFKTLMLKGEAGGTISSIEKTSSVGDVDTYTITLNDGTTSTFEVTNGSNIASIEKTATAGLIDTYTVTLTNGDTSTFEVKNGEDAQLYELPEDCIVAYDKEPELHSLTGVNGYVAFDAYGVKNVKVTGYTKQATTTGKNLFNGESNWINANINSSGVVVPLTDGRNSAVCDKFIKIDSSAPVTISWSSFPVTPAWAYVVAYSTNSDSGFLESYRVRPNTSVTYANSLNAEYIKIWFYNGGQVYENSIPVDCQIEKGSTATSYEPYTGGKPSPNPDFPQDIIGYGTKEQDGTYTIDIEVTDNDDNVYNITASGLAYPLYAGDVLDFENSKVIRAKGYKVFDGSEDWAVYSNYNGYSLEIDDLLTQNYGSGKSNRFISANSSTVGNDNGIRFGANNKRIYLLNVNISGVTDLTSWKTYLANNETYIVYPLASPTEESVTISGDTAIVENLRGWTQVDAWDEDVTLDVWYYSDVDFPDGYEEVGLPIDDLLYYQDEEYIEFPQSWGFAIGYVFDASEIRFIINATKKFHDGFSVEANRSLSLALDSYMGAGGGGTITGFNFVDASFIKEYGQIQIRLKTENPHGLPLGALLGARVNTGRLRITFKAPE